MHAQPSERWRGHLKTALAATISRAHDYGFASALARGRTRPLVLGYHRVVDNFAAVARTGMPSMLTSARMFERHLDSIARQFQFVSLDEIGAHIESGRPFERPMAAVTFDDGYADVYQHAYPVLRRKGIPAAVFVVTDLVGQPLAQVHDRLYHVLARAFTTWANPQRELHGLLDTLGLTTDAFARMPEAFSTPQLTVATLLPALPMADIRRIIEALDTSLGGGACDMPRALNWAEIAEMHRGGITIGSHTRTHVSLPLESAADMADELAGSRAALESRLGAPVAHFAYPGGQFGTPVIDAVARAGYRYAYTACQHQHPRQPAFTIERLLLWEGSSVDAYGRFSPAILNCQAQDLWPPSRKCDRVHEDHTGEWHE